VPNVNADSGERAWRLRAWDDSTIEEAFLEESIIAISADEIGDVTEEPSEAQFLHRLERAPSFAARSPRALRIFVGYWRVFRCEMTAGDIVVVPLTGRRVAVGEISGGYRYRAEIEDPRLRHVRDVQWLTVCPRDMLDRDIRSVVDAPGTVCSIRAVNAATRLRSLAG
jgi:predicted Mrr-cat superfamily restriction endonuclease